MCKEVRRHTGSLVMNRRTRRKFPRVRYLILDSPCAYASPRVKIIQRPLIQTSEQFMSEQFMSEIESNESLLRYTERLAMDRGTRGEGAQDPDTASSLTQIGIIHEQKGNYDVEMRKYTGSLAVERRQRRKGVKHRDIAETPFPLCRTGSRLARSRAIATCLTGHFKIVLYQTSEAGCELSSSAVADSLPPSLWSRVELFSIRSSWVSPSPSP